MVSGGVVRLGQPSTYLLVELVRREHLGGHVNTDVLARAPHVRKPPAAPGRDLAATDTLLAVPELGDQPAHGCGDRGTVGVDGEEVVGGGSGVHRSSMPVPGLRSREALCYLDIKRC